MQLVVQLLPFLLLRQAGDFRIQFYPEIIGRTSHTDGIAMCEGEGDDIGFRIDRQSGLSVRKRGIQAGGQIPDMNHLELVVQYTLRITALLAEVPQLRINLGDYVRIVGTIGNRDHFVVTVGLVDFPQFLDQGYVPVASQITGHGGQLCGCTNAILIRHCHPEHVAEAVLVRKEHCPAGALELKGSIRHPGKAHHALHEDEALYSRHGRQDLGAYHRGNHDAVTQRRLGRPDLVALQRPPSQQGGQFVASEDLPASTGIQLGDRQTICIRIVGQDNGTVLRLGLNNGQPEGLLAI